MAANNRFQGTPHKVRRPLNRDVRHKMNDKQMMSCPKCGCRMQTGYIPIPTCPNIDFIPREDIHKKTVFLHRLYGVLNSSGAIAATLKTGHSQLLPAHRCSNCCVLVFEYGRTTNWKNDIGQKKERGEQGVAPYVAQGAPSGER